MSSSAKSVGIKPPVQLFGLDGTYATALFTAASKETSIESASKSLAKLSETAQKDKKLNVILTNPALSAHDRKTVAQTLAKVDSNLDSTVRNFLNVLAENNRLDLLPKVSSQFNILADAYNGLVQGSVTSAQALDQKSFKRIEKALAQSSLVGKGKSLKLENVVKPEIQGGLVVEIGENTIDLSVASKIQKLNKVLVEDV